MVSKFILLFNNIWKKLKSILYLFYSFNRIDLPPYENYQELREKLNKAIEGSGSYGGGD